MRDFEIARERKRAKFSIALTVLSMAFLVAVFVKGPQWVLLVFSLGFMAGYIFERVQLAQRLTLLLQREASPQQAGAAVRGLWRGGPGSSRAYSAPTPGPCQLGRAEYDPFH